MFERFTDRARAALREAQTEAADLNHDFVGTEHLLLGLLHDSGSVAGRVFAREGITLETARAAVVRIIGPCPPGTADRAEAGAAAPPAAGPDAIAASSVSDSDAEALATIGIDLDQVRSAVEASFGPGALDRVEARGRRSRRACSARSPRLTPRAKKVLELSLREALSLGHNYIGTEHLLLALVGVGEGVAYEVLDELAPPAAHLREGVLAELDQRMRPGA